MDIANILVVIDAQVDFATGSLGTKEARSTIPAIVEKIEKRKEAGYIILATKDTHDGGYLNTNEGRHLPVPHTIAGTEGWEIVPGIRKALDKCGAMTVIKDRFGSMDLPSVIRTLASDRLSKPVTDGGNLAITLIGWCTDICVVTNALLLKTAFPGAKIVVDSKCCAGVTPESHKAALTVMRSCQITVI